MDELDSYVLIRGQYADVQVVAPARAASPDVTHVRRGREPLLAMVPTLGYSRATFVRFTTDETASTLCAALAEAFDYIGGVPAELLLDNAKSVVIEGDAYGAGAHR